jgi:hypothetical protein
MAGGPALAILFGGEHGFEQRAPATLAVVALGTEEKIDALGAFFGKAV